ncbi:MAG: hypothetical protein ABWY66_04780, partial [Xanthobacteraceae bacterium]
MIRSYCAWSGRGGSGLPSARRMNLLVILAPSTVLLFLKAEGENATRYRYDHADDTGPASDPSPPFTRRLLPFGVLSVFLTDPVLDLSPSHQAATKAGHLGIPVSHGCNL